MSGAVLHTTAVLADREVLAELRHGWGGLVHSVFRSAINIFTGRPELLSLNSASVVRGPRSIRLGLDRMDHYGVIRDDKVACDGHTLLVGESLVVVVAATPAWPDNRINGTPVLERVEQFDVLLGIPTSLRGRGQAERGVKDQLETSMAALRTSLHARDEAATGRAARSLVGVGPGLTATGDDVLAGAAFVASLLGGRLGGVHRAVQGIVDGAGTNDLSLTALRCALRGRAAQPLEDLYASICGASTDSPDHLVADVKAIGTTSGADLALGLLTAVRLHLDFTTDQEAAVRV